MYLLTQLWVYLAVAFAIGALLGYWFWSWCRSRDGLSGNTGAGSVAVASAASEIKAALARAEAHLASERKKHDAEIVRLKSQNGGKKHDTEIADLRRKLDEMKRHADEAARKHADDLKTAITKTEAAQADALNKKDAEILSFRSEADTATKYESELADLRRKLDESKRHSDEAARKHDEVLKAAIARTEARFTDTLRMRAEEITTFKKQVEAGKAKETELSELKRKLDDAKKNADEAAKQHANDLKSAAAKFEASHNEALKNVSQKQESDIADLRRKLDEAKRLADNAYKKHAEDLKSAALKAGTAHTDTLRKKDAEIATLRSQADAAKRHEAELADLHRKLDEAKTLETELADARRKLDEAKRAAEAAANNHASELAAATSKAESRVQTFVASIGRDLDADAAELQGTLREPKSVIRSTPSKARPKKHADGGPERLKSPRKGKADDLKLIWGVAEELEKKLHALGFWHFDQIAKWSDADVKWVMEKLGDATDRISRDKWIEQCKKLVSGWRPENEIGDRPQ